MRNLISLLILVMLISGCAGGGWQTKDENKLNFLDRIGMGLYAAGGGDPSTVRDRNQLVKLEEKRISQNNKIEQERLPVGYTSTKLQDDVFKIRFRGDYDDSMEKVEDLTILRCAEATIDSGYKYFIVMESKSVVEKSSYTTSTSAYASGSSKDGKYSGTTTVFGGNTQESNIPSASYTIKCFKTKPKNNQSLVYDAEQLKDNIR